MAYRLMRKERERRKRKRKGKRMRKRKGRGVMNFLRLLARVWLTALCIIGNITAYPCRRCPKIPSDTFNTCLRNFYAIFLRMWQLRHGLVDKPCDEENLSTIPAPAEREGERESRKRGFICVLCGSWRPLRPGIWGARIKNC